MDNKKTKLTISGNPKNKIKSIQTTKSKGQKTVFIDKRADRSTKKVSFSIANSPLVKTAIAGEDPNWGRIIMAIGKADVNLNPNKISIKLGHISIIENGKLLPSYNEYEAADYMKSEKIDLIINLNLGKKDFTSYTMDLTKKYVEINSDYRT